MSQHGIEINKTKIGAIFLATSLFFPSIILCNSKEDIDKLTDKQSESETTATDMSSQGLKKTRKDTDSAIKYLPESEYAQKYSDSQFDVIQQYSDDVGKVVDKLTDTKNDLKKQTTEKIFGSVGDNSFGGFGGGFGGGSGGSGGSNSDAMGKEVDKDKDNEKEIEKANKRANENSVKDIKVTLFEMKNINKLLFQAKKLKSIQ